MKAGRPAALKEVDGGDDGCYSVSAQYNRDARLERLIKAATAIYGAPPTPVRLQRLTRLLNARSPAAVQRLERERGLAPKHSPDYSPNPSPSRGKVTAGRAA